MPSNNKQTIISLIKKFGRLLWDNLTVLITLIFCLTILTASFCFWQYYINREVDQKSAPESASLNYILLQSFLSDFQKRQENFVKVLDKKYDDPFKGLNFATLEQVAPSVNQPTEPINEVEPR